jgi:hypothetical protein
MKVTGDYTFEAPQQLVWEALQDPTVLTSVLPGCEKLEEVGEKKYEGELNIRVGPVQGKFQGKIDMQDLRAPEHFEIVIDGRGAPGFVKATASVDLEASGEHTIMHYASDAQVGGRVASVGQRLLDSSAKSIIRQSLDGLHALMKAKVASAAAPAASQDPAAGESPGSGGDESTAEMPAAAPAYQPPSQAEFAARVAKDVASDLIPKPVWIALGILVLALLAYFLLT